MEWEAAKEEVERVLVVTELEVAAKAWVMVADLEMVAAEHPEMAAATVTAAAVAAAGSPAPGTHARQAPRS